MKKQTQQNKQNTKNYLGSMPSVRLFLRDYQMVWWVIAGFLLVTYGIKIFNVSISHDTEAIIAVPANLYKSWFTMGRFGLVYLKKLLATDVFNPYTASVLTVLSMLFNSMLWLYLFEWVGGWKRRPALAWIFPTFFFTSMIMAEQSGFLLQSYEVNVALLLVGVAIMCFFQTFVGNRRKWLLLPACVCCVIAFSSYQSLVPLFTAAVAICFLLFYDRMGREQKEPATYSFYFRLIGQLIVGFVVSFMMYQIAAKMIMMARGLETTSYITEQIMWGTVPAGKSIYNIVRHIYRAIFGKSLFYNGFNLVIYVGMLGYLVARIWKKQKCYVLFLLAAIYSLGSPFLMSVLMGTEPTYRTQILLPFVAGFFLWYLLEKLWNWKNEQASVLHWCALVVIALVMIHQSSLSARLYYTQYCRYQEDLRTAAQITERIDMLGVGEPKDTPVVFIGSIPVRENTYCYRNEELELIGRSFFSVSLNTNHGTWVMRNFLATQGYEYEFPKKEAVFEKAEKAALEMPCWPAEGSVAQKDGVVIVKLHE